MVLTADPRTRKSLRQVVASAWLAPPKASAVDWIPKNLKMPEETETAGEDFDLSLFPHVRAVLEAIDDPMIRQIYLPWATRCAKTTTCIAIMAFFAANAPRPSLLAAPDEETADRTIRDSYYPLLEKCKVLAPQLPPPQKRNKKYIRFRRSRIRRGFAGAPSTLAGFPACYIHFTECSKPQRKSTEADAIRLVTQRAKLYPFESKILFESSPGLKGHCKITELCMSINTDRRWYWVPCPHCGEYQQLRRGSKDSVGGLKWDKDAEGHSDLFRAESTAWYQCCHCRGRIENHHRADMMNSGRWLSEGLAINAQGEVSGTARVRSPNVAFGDPTAGAGRGLSSLYSLKISGWGQYAREYLESVTQKDGRRDFANGNEGEEYDPSPVTVKPDDLVKRLVTIDTQAVCPLWSTFAVLSIDVQMHATIFPWTLTAWGPGQRGALVDWGEARSFAEVEQLRLRTWPHADQGHPLPVQYAGIDSRYETVSVYSYVRGKSRLKCLKGSTTEFPQLYKVRPLEDEGLDYIEVNTQKSQEWIQSLIEGDISSADPRAFTLPAQCANDPDLIAQLLNEHKIDGVDKDGYPVVVWKRRHVGMPNDYRDCIRYGWTLAQVVTSGGTRWNSLPARNAPVRTEPPRPVLTTDDGRPWLITER